MLIGPYDHDSLLPSPNDSNANRCHNQRAFSTDELSRSVEAARTAWISEAKLDEEKQERWRADVLAYVKHAGCYADFHSRQHLFITNLERAGIHPKVAQTLSSAYGLPCSAICGSMPVFRRVVCEGKSRL